MCNHRAVGRWGRIWDTFLVVTLTTGTALEVYGLITVGPEATLSTNLQTKAGATEPCRHTWLGRTVICAFSAWIAVHLGWSRLGFGGLLHRPRHVVHDQP